MTDMDDIPDRRTATGFDSDLSVRAITASTWSLLSPLIWTGTQGDTFVVPVGFVTDFATIPRFLHWLVSPYGAYTRAAVLHDWLLVELAAWTTRYQKEFPDIDRRYKVLRVSYQPPATSRDCDGIFRRVMQDLGVPWAKRWAMWSAVRWAALFNPDRAYGRGFAKDAPTVIAVSVAALPIVLPGVIGVLISLTLARILSWPTSRKKERS